MVDSSTLVGGCLSDVSMHSVVRGMVMGSLFVSVVVMLVVAVVPLDVSCPLNVMSCLLLGVILLEDVWESMTLAAAPESTITSIVCCVVVLLCWGVCIGVVVLV